MKVACGGSVPEGYGEDKPQFPAAEQVLDDAETHTAVIRTSCGEVRVELLSAQAPRDREQLRVPCGPWLLRRDGGPPGRPGVRGADG